MPRPAVGASATYNGGYRIVIAPRSAVRFRYLVSNFTAHKQSVILLPAALAGLERMRRRLYIFCDGPLAGSQGNSLTGVTPPAWSTEESGHEACRKQSPLPYSSGG